MNIHPCPRGCGAAVYDLHTHVAWHDTLDREMASLRDALPTVEHNSQRIADLELAVSR